MGNNRATFGRVFGEGTQIQPMNLPIASIDLDQSRLVWLCASFLVGVPRGLPKQAAALNSGRTEMEMNTRNIIIAAVVVVVIVVGGYSLVGSGDDEGTVEPAAATE